MRLNFYSCPLCAQYKDSNGAGEILSVRKTEYINIRYSKAVITDCENCLNQK